MKMKTAVLFPGQGAQYFGMGKDLYDHYEIVKQIYHCAEEVVGWKIADLCFKHPNELIHQTRYTQAALFVTNYAIFKVLEQYGLKMQAVLGFSLGEFDAIVASGALDFEATLKLVDQRGLWMEECANASVGGMSAVLGLSANEIEACLQKQNEEGSGFVAVANDNSKMQVTIAGEKKALQEAEERLLAWGAKRVVPLKVSGAFHTRLMEQASIKLRKAVTPIAFKEPEVKLISNVTAREMSKEEIKQNIPRQVMQGVRFRESMLYLKNLGFEHFIEVGPKTTLSRLTKQIIKDASVSQVEDDKTIKAWLSLGGE